MTQTKLLGPFGNMPPKAPASHTCGEYEGLDKFTVTYPDGWVWAVPAQNSICSDIMQGQDKLYYLRPYSLNDYHDTSGISMVNIKSNDFGIKGISLEFYNLNVVKTFGYDEILDEKPQGFELHPGDKIQGIKITKTPVGDDGISDHHLYPVIQSIKFEVLPANDAQHLVEYTYGPGTDGEPMYYPAAKGFLSGMNVGNYHKKDVDSYVCTLGFYVEESDVLVSSFTDDL
jgi:hypothetical protein